MKVCIPRTLLYHRYGQFWEKFLTGLGVEVVVSRRTDKVLLQNGLGHVSSEVCLPIKIMAGHIEELAGQIDVLFLPRLLWLEDKLYACPKMIGIVDIARMMIGDRVRIVAPKIQGSLWLPHFGAGMELCHDPVRVVRALARAKQYMPAHDRIPDFPAGEKRVALI